MQEQVQPRKGTCSQLQMPSPPDAVKREIQGTVSWWGRRCCGSKARRKVNEQLGMSDVQGAHRLPPGELYALPRATRPCGSKRQGHLGGTGRKGVGTACEGARPQLDARASSTKGNCRLENDENRAREKTRTRSMAGIQAYPPGSADGGWAADTSNTPCPTTTPTARPTG